MRPEDLEDDKTTQNEITNDSSAEQSEDGAEELNESTHSDYKVPGKDGRVSYHLSGMYQNWFLDYASYVILERAVPHIEDGLKPVQRRILHSMKRLDDGRYNKVANIVGHTMQFHPHGDASIGDALVQLGQKDLLIDCTFPQVLDRMVEEFPDQYAFRYTTLDYTRTYSQFRDDVDEFARSLIGGG